MEINQTSTAFAGAAVSAPVQTQVAQETTRKESQEVESTTANPAAASDTDLAVIGADGATQAEPTAPTQVAETEETSNTRPEGERGAQIDILV